MRTGKKRMAAAIVCLLCVLTLLPYAVLAAGIIEIDREATLCVRLCDGETALSGVPVSIYRVADMSAYGELTLYGDFADDPVRLNGLDAEGWHAAAETLTGYVLRDKRTAFDSGKSGTDGVVMFPQSKQALLPGLYLVLCGAFSQDGYSYALQPSLVLLPVEDTGKNEWNYDVSIAPKHTRQSLPPTPTEETVERRVLKVWDDGDASDRPEKIVVQLLKNGVVYDSVTLSRHSDWRHTWSGLPKYDASGRLIDWRVTERTVDGYTVSVRQEGVTFVVTNTRENAPPKPAEPMQNRLPQTGELWWPVALLGVCGLALILIAILPGEKKRHA